MGDSSDASPSGRKSRGSVISHPAFASAAPAAVSAGLDQTGSLLRMFRSEAFDAHLHVAYLFKMKDNQGVQDYLTNELYRMRERDVDFYLPELCLMALSRPAAEKLHAFLLDKAAAQMYSALKIHWWFQSAVEDKPLNAEQLETAMRLYQESEMAVVNSRVFSSRVVELRHRSESAPTSPSARAAVPVIAAGAEDENLAAIRELSRHIAVRATELNLFDRSLKLMENLGDAVPSSTAHWRGGALAAAYSPNSTRVNELDLFMLKQLRCDCFNGLINFVGELTRISTLLVACPTQQDRRKLLNLALAQINQWLFDRRLAVALSGGEIYMTGVSLPLPWVTSETTHVLKIHIEECKVFRTRQRAPYLIALEVVDFSDLHDGESLAGLVKQELPLMNAPEEDGLSVQETGKHRLELASTVPAEEELAQTLKSVDVQALTNQLYPEWLLTGVNRRGSVTTPVVAPIVVDEAAVTVIPSPAPELVRKSQKKATVELRRKVFGDLNEDRIEAIRSQSVYGRLPSWRLQKIIVKGGDDVRQEVLAGQLISLFRSVFHTARLPLWLRPYAVVPTSANSGLIELVPNTVSIDALKKEFPGQALNEVFSQIFADHMEEAQLNFIESCAAYAVVCYLLQVKDRHNGNLLLDSDGHLVHIDFGFMLANAPGGTFALETSPFKLTQEYLDVMGGEYSSQFETFRTLIIRAFLEARRYRDQICQLVRIVGECNPKLACFAGNVDAAVNALSDRFCVALTEEACIERVVALIDESLNNWRTVQYDNYQRITNGIL